MKKLLFILSLFVSCAGSGQITFLHKADGFQTLGIGSIGSTTYTGGKLYILFAGTTNTSSPATVSLSGGATTWTEIANIVSDDGTMRLQAFRYAPASNETTAVTVTYTGTQNGGFVQMGEITGADVTGTNGSNAIVQAVTDAIDANANPSITMSALTGNNAAIVGFINNLNPFGGTVEAGWTDRNQSGYATPDCGGLYMTRPNAGDNTPTVTAATSNWAGIAIEIKSAARRRINITKINTNECREIHIARR